MAIKARLASRLDGIVTAFAMRKIRPDSVFNARLTVVLALVASTAFLIPIMPAAQAQAMIYARQFGTAGFDSISGLAVDSADAAYVVGSTSGNLAGPVSGIYDAYIRKYSSDGTMLWTRQFGTDATDGADGVDLDATGAYVTGFAGDDLTGAGSTGNIYIRKYDAVGSVLWTRQSGTGAGDQPFDISVHSSGIYVVGYTNGDLEGTNAGDSDGFIRKYSSDGLTVLWTDQFGTAELDWATGLAVDPSSGAAYVAGRTAGSIEGTGAGGEDAFVRKYDAAGNVLWTRQFGSVSGDAAREVALDPAGGVYVNGITSGNLQTTSAGFTDVFVRKYDPDGNVVWTRQFGTAGADGSNGIDADPTGIYVSGEADGDLAAPLSGLNDLFIRKYDPDGNVIWTTQFGSTEFEFDSSVATGSSGVYVAGSTHGDLEGASAGSSDSFVAKFDKGPAPPPPLFCGKDASAFDSIVDGTPGDDFLMGTAGNDLIRGQAGNDKILAKAGDDCVLGGEGDDRMWGGDGNDVMEGNLGNDMIVGDGWMDKLYGGFGDDRMWGGAAGDELWGGEGNDMMVGDGGKDELHGDDGDDKLWGGSDDDVMSGGNNNDRLIGDSGNDMLNGESGDDRLYDKEGDDALDGGPEFDRCYDKVGTNTIVNCNDKRVAFDQYTELAVPNIPQSLRGIDSDTTCPDASVFSGALFGFGAVTSGDTVSTTSGSWNLLAAPGAAGSDGGTITAAQITSASFKLEGTWDGGGAAIICAAPIPATITLEGPCGVGVLVTLTSSNGVSGTYKGDVICTTP